MTTFAEEWERYRSKCVPKEASDIQIRETKQAFYAGAITCFDMQVSACTCLDQHISVARIQSIQTELFKFVEVVRAL